MCIRDRFLVALELRLRQRIGRLRGLRPGLGGLLPQLQIRGIQPGQHLSGLHTLSNFGRQRDKLARHAKPDTRLGSGPHCRCRLAASRAGLGLQP